MTPYSLAELAAAHRAALLSEATGAALARVSKARRPPRTRRPLASVLARLLPGRALRPRPAS
jgi:hypothetical protein